MDFSFLKAGDRVWLGRNGRKSQIKPVLKVTRTQIVIDWNGNGNYLCRYKIQGGWRIGGGALTEHIVGLAGPDECARWDAQQEAERRQQQAKNDEKERLEAKRQDLVKLFGGDTDNLVVSQELWGNERERKDKWAVEFHNLSEAQVIALSKLVAHLAKESVKA